MIKRRDLIGGVGLVGIGAGLAGCAGTRVQPAGGTAPSGDSGAEDGAFPVTLEHKYGSTTIDGPPERVVCVGLKEQDDLLALGIVPVAATKWLAFENGILGEWAAELANPSEITQLSQDDGVQFEKVAGLEPDLILALYSGLTQDDYDRLSQLAPVIAPPTGVVDYGIGWEEQAITVGRAVGRPEEMQGLVDEAKASISDAAEQHPEFAGSSGLVATLYEGIYLYGPQDPRSRILTEFGFELPAELGKITGEESFGASISEERIDLLDTDLLIWLVSPSTKDFKTMEQNKLYRNLRVAQEGRAITISSNTPLDNAFNFVSVLSVPFLVDRLVPQLVAAVDGDPATEPDA